MLHHIFRALIVAGLVASAEESVGLRRQSHRVQNESVVYRFVPAGRSTLIALLADQIIKGKRVPMYNLDFQYGETAAHFRATYSTTHGKWEYKVDSDSMGDTGIVLPHNRLRVVLR